MCGAAALPQDRPETRGAGCMHTESQVEGRKRQWTRRRHVHVHVCARGCVMCVCVCVCVLGVGWVWGWVCVPKSVSFVANKASEYVTVNARWAEQSMAMAPIMKRHVSNFCRKSMRNL